MSEINKALIKFQSEMKPVTKDAFNPHYKKPYADLSSVLVDALPILTKNGLGITQTLQQNGELLFLKTSLIHTSGEFIDSTVGVPQMQDPQKLGIWITYLKRYSLMAMLGVATEDDDANGVSIDMVPGNQNAVAGRPIGNEPGPSEKQIAMIKKLGAEKGVTGNIPKTGKEASDLIAKLIAMPAVK